MIPIYLETGGEHKALGFAEFEQSFIDLCEDHHVNKRAAAFAFLLFDFTSPEIAKILRDSDYWSALDQISGRFLTVFSIHAASPSIAPETSNMRGVESASGIRTQRFLQKHFGRDLRIAFPSIVFFQVYNRSVVEYFLAEIQRGGVESSFHEIREILLKATSSLAGLTDEELTDPVASFSQLREPFRTGEIEAKVHKGIRIISNVREIISIASFLSGS